MRKNNTAWTWIGIIIIVILVVILGTVLFDQYSTVDMAASLPYNGVGVSPSGSNTAVTQTSTATSTPSSTPIIVATSTSFKAYMDPQSGAVGTSVTIHGADFGASNIVTLNGLTSGSLKGIASPNGHLLTFIVPSALGPNCNPDQACPDFMMLVSPNSYKVSVITGSLTQNFGTFTVTGTPLLPQAP